MVPSLVSREVGLHLFERDTPVAFPLDLPVADSTAKGRVIGPASGGSGDDYSEHRACEAAGHHVCPR